jgi:hypothetical protein
MVSRKLRECRLGGLSMTAIALWFPNPRCCKALLSNDLYASFSSGGRPY